MIKDNPSQQELQHALTEIKTSLIDINLKLDHLIRTHHDEFFETRHPGLDHNLM